MRQIIEKQRKIEKIGHQNTENLEKGYQLAKNSRTVCHWNITKSSTPHQTVMKYLCPSNTR